MTKAGVYIAFVFDIEFDKFSCFLCLQTDDMGACVQNIDSEWVAGKIFRTKDLADVAGRTRIASLLPKFLGDRARTSRVCALCILSRRLFVTRSENCSVEDCGKRQRKDDQGGPLFLSDWIPLLRLPHPWPTLLRVASLRQSMLRVPRSCALQGRAVMRPTRRVFVSVV